MSDSSQPKNLYQGFDAQTIDSLLKECVIDLSGTGSNMNDVTITNSYNSYNYSNISISSGAVGAGAYTVSIPSSSDTITLTGIDSYSAFNIPVEWIDTFPQWSRVQDMCEKYPGLKIAFENFKVIYEMVKDDYDNPVPKK